MTGIFLPPNYQSSNKQTMTEKDFAYWLKGFFEIANPKTLTKEQIQVIKDHLDLVFNKVTPSRPAWSGFSGYSSYSGVSC